MLLRLAALSLEGKWSLRSGHSFPTRRSSDLGGGCRKRALPGECEEFLRSRRGFERAWESFPTKCCSRPSRHGGRLAREDRKSTRLNSSHMSISYAVFCLKKNKIRFYASLLLS